MHSLGRTSVYPVYGCSCSLWSHSDADRTREDGGARARSTLSAEVWSQHCTCYLVLSLYLTEEIGPFIPMRRLRFREMNLLAQGHIAEVAGL